MVLITKDKSFDMEVDTGKGPEGKLLVLCDFDGTVCTVDMGNQILDRFAEGWEEIDRAYCAGEVGSRIAYSRIAPLFRANREQLVAYALKNERIDPSFPEFFLFARGRRIDIKIVSDGVDTYIDAILKKHGLGVEFFSNRLVFHEEDRIDFAFPLVNEECGRCGTCKRALLRRFRREYDRIAYVGDGYSDICPAQEADLVFAKEILYEKCVGNGTPAILYHDFNDIRRYLEKKLVINHFGDEATKVFDV